MTTMMRFHYLLEVFFLLFTIIDFHPANSQLLTGLNIPGLNLVEQFQQSSRLRGTSESPLILSPLIAANQSAKARKLATVNKELFLNVTSYSGYLTVDEKNNGNLFFWFFPAEGTEYLYDEDTAHFNGSTEKPVVLWLQGGPGFSSLYALFTENGPFLVNNMEKIIRENPYSWHKYYSLLYVDSPVNTGFSFSDSYVKNMTQVGQHMYRFLTQFFDLFPMLKKNDFFITGESFAGKYIPAIANEIYDQNIKINGDEKKRINLKGIALGDAFSDPYNMMDYSDYAYQLGLVGPSGYNEMKTYEDLVRKNIDDPIKAFDYWTKVITSFCKKSDYENIFNIQQPKSPYLYPYFEYIKQPQIREAIHVGSIQFQPYMSVFNNLLGDFMTTAIHWVEKLLDNGLRVLYYNGNWDLIVAYPLSENAFKHMKWSGAEKYRNATRNPFLINRIVKGYIRKADNFAEAAILNAGHMAPADQPLVCLKLIDKFFKDQL